MKRRSFIRGILATCVAPMFLPGGGRIWKATFEPWTAITEPGIIINDKWVVAPYEFHFMFASDALPIRWNECSVDCSPKRWKTV